MKRTVKAYSALGTIAAAGLLMTIEMRAEQNARVTTSPNWPCVVTIDSLLSYQDNAGVSQTVPTAIQGDGQGPYANAKEGVECYVNRGATSAHYGNLFLNVDRSSARYFLFPGQTAVTTYSSTTGYDTFQNRQPGYFEITRIDTAAVAGATVRRRVRVGVGSGPFDAGEMWGDSLAGDALAVGSSSAWITPLDNCSWKVAWYPSAALEGSESAYIPRVLALREGSSRRRSRTADFSMPFSATVTITGVKSGCGTVS